ncbi:Ger(x)C family spore germination protein [Paenibacillaceae bacterium]|nr:Ger(x)C family spore germination protein [Paenibacillaceae bacterium]
MKTNRSIRLNCAALSLLLCSCVLLGGCWDSKEIQFNTYVSSYGIDYFDGQYHTFAQVLDFTSIASTESSGTNEPSPVWVGKGQGSTIASAFSTLYRTSQQNISWGHITSLIISERAMKAKQKEIFDSLNRFRELRYNIMIYGTNEPIENLLSATPFFRLSPLASILNNPEENYKQNSVIPPQHLFRYIAEYNEISMSSYLPSLSLNHSQWEEAKRPHSLLEINGAYFETGGNLKGFISWADLQGFQWLNKKTNTTYLTLGSPEPYSSIILRRPQFTIKPIVEGDKARFRIKLTIKATLLEMLKEQSEAQIERDAAEAIKQQIMTLFKKGVQKEIDIYLIGDTLFRSSPHVWDKLTNHGTRFLLDEHSIEQLDVTVKLVNTGKYKLYEAGRQA